MMGIGLSGAHRTGKTTLAKAFAEVRGMEYRALPNVIAGMSLEPKDITTMDIRLKVQRELTNACAKTFYGAVEPFVSDRTPIDVAAYTLADAGQGNMTDVQQDEMLGIIEDCLEIATTSFMAILLIQPGIPYVPEKGKPLPNVAYQEHVHMLVQGLLGDERMGTAYYKMPLAQTDHEMRLQAMIDMYDPVLENMGYEAESYQIT